MFDIVSCQLQIGWILRSAMFTMVWFGKRKSSVPQCKNCLKVFLDNFHLDGDGRGPTRRAFAMKLIETIQTNEDKFSCMPTLIREGGRLCEHFISSEGIVTRSRERLFPPSQHIYSDNISQDSTLSYNLQRVGDAAADRLMRRLGCRRCRTLQQVQLFSLRGMTGPFSQSRHKILAIMNLGKMKIDTCNYCNCVETGPDFSRIFSGFLSDRQTCQT